ncbi:hypothetical protein HZZ02_18170 [Streptococcus danieliae]|nr:hypothetical protein [Streptococcus danieliae]
MGSAHSRRFTGPQQWNTLGDQRFDASPLEDSTASRSPWSAWGALPIPMAAH